jgi:hypothetical protein
MVSTTVNTKEGNNNNRSEIAIKRECDVSPGIERYIRIYIRRIYMYTDYILFYCRQGDASNESGRNKYVDSEVSVSIVLTFHRLSIQY